MKMQYLSQNYADDVLHISFHSLFALPHLTYMKQLLSVISYYYYFVSAFPT